jgi:hypothetical protein
VFVLTVLALAAVSALAWAISRGERSGRHQRSAMGPVRGDGSGLTDEGVAMHVDIEHVELSGRFRGPEDDPAFLLQLSRVERPEPPAEG